MTVVSKVPQLIGKKGGSYSAVAPRLEPGKFNKLKKNDIMESVISCEIAKSTWTNLVHNFEGPSDTKENRIIDLKLEYQTFRAKSFETLSQAYTHCKTLLDELANDGVTLSKHEINVKNSDDEADERSSEEYLNDPELEFHERALQGEPKVQKDHKAEYKKMKAKLALLDDSPSTS
ncbi:hypothetical protein Tco_0832214 [Tanacetum coccineum]